MLIARALRERAQAYGAIVNQRITTVRKLLRHGRGVAGVLAGGGANATFLTAPAFDGLLRLEEDLRIQVASGLAAATDIPRGRRQTEERQGRQERSRRSPGRWPSRDVELHHR